MSGRSSEYSSGTLLLGEAEQPWWQGSLREARAHHSVEPDTVGFWCSIEGDLFETYFGEKAPDVRPPVGFGTAPGPDDISALFDQTWNVFDDVLDFAVPDIAEDAAQHEDVGGQDVDERVDRSRV